MNNFGDGEQSNNVMATEFQSIIILRINIFIVCVCVYVYFFTTSLPMTISAIYNIEPTRWQQYQQQ